MSKHVLKLSSPSAEQQHSSFSVINLMAIRDPHYGALNTGGMKTSRFSTNICFISGNDTRQDHIQIIQWNADRDLHTPYSRVSFRMTFSDLE